MSRTKEVRVPDIGDFDEVEVIDVLVGEGDRVEPEDPLITLESDKAAMDMPSPQAGRVKSIKVAKGDKVSEGSLVLELEIEEGGGEEEQKERKEKSEQQERKQKDSQPQEQQAPQRKRAGAQRDSDKRSGRGRREEIRVPDIGDFENVEVIDVRVGEGDHVEPEDPLITLESDKAAMDVPAPKAGRIVELKVVKGDKVSAGDPIAVIETPGDEEKGDTVRLPRPQPIRAEKKQRKQEQKGEGAVAGAEKPLREPPTPARGATAPTDEAGFAKAYAGPSVRKFARELGVALAQVPGSGNKGRIIHDDVKAWVKQRLESAAEAPGGVPPKLPQIDFGQFGEIETKPLSRIQKISGPRLRASWVNIPHVAQFDEADITELEQKRTELKTGAEAEGIKLTPLAFILKACVDALKEFPPVNSSLAPDGEHLILKKYFHLGFAVDTPNGLIVPVIRDVDRKDIYEIARELARLSDDARGGRLKREALQGGCFTVSSLGSLGGTNFTPIINAPEVAILGVARATMKPVWQEGRFVPRLMLPFSLCYDHRVVDGALAVRFTGFLAKRLGDVQDLIQAIP